MTKERSLFIFMIAAAGIAAAVWILGFHDLGGRMERIASLEAELATAEADRAALASLKGLAARTESDRRILESQFVGKADAVSYIEYMESLAEEAGADLTVDRAEEGEALVLDFLASGSFASVYRFLVFAESAPYAAEFERARLLKDEEGEGWTGALSIKLLQIGHEEEI